MPNWEPIVAQLVEQPYAIADGVLSNQIVTNLQLHVQNALNTDQLRPAGVSQDGSVQTGIRGDSIKWLDEKEPAEADIISIIVTLQSYLNRTCYTRLREMELQMAHYAPGSYYRRHRDQFWGYQNRQLTVILYLNTNWQPADGGELRLYLPDNTIDISPIVGRLVVFRSELPHEVLITNRDRFSISGWLKE